ncbi:F-box protein CPR1-like [Arachis stenosperma]|uniref:F-box protein CPR1-like n=1 Tax=Arachis stenosperma TaxID=217475 RepID=UPI0025AD773F|nr:F-box protein CPR1-like [Arachis stenosperma]
MLFLYFLVFLLFLVVILLPRKSNEILSSKLALPSTKSRTKEKVSIEHLPEELLSNILSRLPSKELQKCKFVCKSWFHLIKDPHFVTKYYVVYNNHIVTNHDLFVIGRPFPSSKKTFISLLSCNSNDNITNKNKEHVPSKVLNPPCEYNSDHEYWTEIMGPCNGIYFLEGKPNLMMNPSLGQFKALPESHFATPFGGNSLMDYTGFGFDPKTNDYKVVVIKDLWIREKGEEHLGWWRTELYSLNSNSWRRLDAVLPLPIEIWSSSRVYTLVNNCCHWLGYVEDEFGKRKDVVLAFDMVNETFRKIHVPRVRDCWEESSATLVPRDESARIGMVVHSVKRYDVWVMKDYWSQESWVKVYSVGPVQVISTLAGICGRDQFLWKNNNEELVMYEAESGKVKCLQVFGKNDSLRAARYMESILSLHRGNEFSGQCVSIDWVHDR